MTKSAILRPVFLYLGISILAFGVLSSCARAGKEARIPDDWPSWRKTTNLELNYPIPGHEDKYRVIRMNDVGWNYMKTSPSGRLEFPSGTLVAKEIYATTSPAPGEKPLRLTAMIKAPNDPNARGGWVWVVKDLGNGSEMVFSGAFCYTCHNNANEAHPYGDKNPRHEFRDFLFIPPGRDGTSAGTVP